jgi:hypothetical protein
MFPYYKFFMEDVIVTQQVSIADYFHSRGLFDDLGGHFSRCHKPELDLMNKGEAYPLQVCAGMKALTEEAGCHDILKLTRALKGYDALWSGLKAGFAEGIKTRLDSKKNDTDLVRLAFGLQPYPDLSAILQDALTGKNHALKIKFFELDGQKNNAVINFKRADQEAEVFVMADGHLSNIKTLSPQKNELRRLAECTFSQQTPA